MYRLVANSSIDKYAYIVYLFVDILYVVLNWANSDHLHIGFCIETSCVKIACNRSSFCGKDM